MFIAWIAAGNKGTVEEVRTQTCDVVNYVCTGVPWKVQQEGKILQSFHLGSLGYNQVKSICILFALPNIEFTTWCTPLTERTLDLPTLDIFGAVLDYILSNESFSQYKKSSISKV